MRHPAVDSSRPTPKSSALRESDVSAFRVAEPFERNLNALRDEQMNGRPLRVLDWGCGRGEMVLRLIEAGHDAYGLDVVETYLRNGRPVFDRRSLDGEDRLRHWETSKPAPFPDGWFDAVVSDVVFEHVRDLDGTLREMRRVLRPGGIAVHQFPSRRRPIEPHVGLPFVHWIPAGRGRRVAIRAMCELGLGSDWARTRGKRASERAAVFDEYLRERTFYRSRRQLEAAATSAGFEARFWGWGSTSRVLRPMRYVPGLRQLRQRYQLSFLMTWMHLRVPSTEPQRPETAEVVVPAGAIGRVRHRSRPHASVEADAPRR